MMKTQARDLMVLIDSKTRARKALESLTFVPPLRIRQVSSPTDPETSGEEPLVYILGQTDGLRRPEAVLDWMDRLRAADGAPVAFLLPRDGFDWCRAATHSQFCGLLPCEPAVAVDSMEWILREARLNLARRWGQGTVRRMALTWSFTTAEAADPEQAWLLLESVLSSVVGPSSDLSCLGMAFAEALTNAVEHGNLELDSSLKDDIDDGLFRFFEEREQRLRDPLFSARRIRVEVGLQGMRIRVRIRNEGRGFDPAAQSRAQERGAEVLHPHGLGLAMIESLVDEVSIAPDGRAITLTHRVPRRWLRSQGVMPSLLPEERRRESAA